MTRINRFYKNILAQLKPQDLSDDMRVVYDQMVENEGDVKIEDQNRVDIHNQDVYNIPQNLETPAHARLSEQNQIIHKLYFDKIRVAVDSAYRKLEDMFVQRRYGATMIDLSAIDQIDALMDRGEFKYGLEILNDEDRDYLDLGVVYGRDYEILERLNLEEIANDHNNIANFTNMIVNDIANIAVSMQDYFEDFSIESAVNVADESVDAPGLQLTPDESFPSGEQDQKIKTFPEADFGRMRRTEAAHHTSSILAIIPSEEADAKIREYFKDIINVDDDLHITLVYLGDSVDVESLSEYVQTVCDAYSPLECKLNGLGLFSHESDNGRPFYCSVDALGLAEFRTALVLAAKESGIDMPNSYDFTPHMTIAYTKDFDKIDLASGTPDISWLSGELVLMHGDEHTKFDLGGHNKEGQVTPKDMETWPEETRVLYDKNVELGKEPVEHPDEPPDMNNVHGEVISYGKSRLGERLKCGQLDFIMQSLNGTGGRALNYVVDIFKGSSHIHIDSDGDCIVGEIDGVELDSDSSYELPVPEWTSLANDPYSDTLSALGFDCVMSYGVAANVPVEVLQAWGDDDGKFFDNGVMYSPIDDVEDDFDSEPRVAMGPGLNLEDLITPSKGQGFTDNPADNHQSENTFEDPDLKLGEVEEPYASGHGPLNFRFDDDHKFNISVGASMSMIASAGNIVRLLGLPQETAVAISSAYGPNDVAAARVIKLLNGNSNELTPEQAIGATSPILNELKSTSISSNKVKYINTNIGSFGSYEDFASEYENAFKELDQSQVVLQSGGLRWVKVPPGDYDLLASQMQHCTEFGGDIYSLRDNKNRPHVTVDIIEGVLDQIQGKQNSGPDAKYLPYVKQLIDSMDLSVDRNVYDSIKALAPDKVAKSSEEVADELIAAGDINAIVSHRSFGVRICVANNPGVASDVLIALARDQEMTVRAYVASNPNVPYEASAMLAQDRDASVRTYVARNKNMQPEILIDLAKDQNVNVRTHVANNQNAPSEALVILAKDESFDVRTCVASNPNVQPEVLAILAKDTATSVRAYVASNRNTPPETLIELAQDQEVNICKYVAGNRSAPSEALAILARHVTDNIRINVAANANTPPDILVGLAQDQDASVRAYVASNPNVQPEVLAILAKDTAIGVRAGVASNLNSTSDILAELARDQDISVLQCVGSNRNTQPEVLHALSRNRNPEVRIRVAANANASSETLIELAQDQHTGVRACVADNRSTPPGALVMLAKDTIGVRSYVARNPSAPPELLAALARDSDAKMRTYVMQNPSTLLETLYELAKDEDIYVRETANVIIQERKAVPTKTSQLKPQDLSDDMRVVYDQMVENEGDVEIEDHGDRVKTYDDYYDMNPGLSKSPDPHRSLVSWSYGIVDGRFVLMERLFHWIHIQIDHESWQYTDKDGILRRGVDIVGAEHEFDLLNKAAPKKRIPMSEFDIELINACLSGNRNYNKKLSQLAISDRYDALGKPNGCKGQCEGTGLIPVMKGDLDPTLAKLWEQAELESPSDDGWHFVKCPDCSKPEKEAVGIPDIEPDESISGTDYGRSDMAIPRDPEKADLLY